MRLGSSINKSQTSNTLENANDSVNGVVTSSQNQVPLQSKYQDELQRLREEQAKQWN
jgi:hypothetical protein